MSLSYKEVAEILKIIDASSCEEVVLELGTTRLVVRRGGASNETKNDETRNLPPKAESITPAQEIKAHSPRTPLSRRAPRQAVMITARR